MSRAYKAPTTADLSPRRYLATDNTPTTPDRQGNPALLPELAWGVDLGYEHHMPGDAGLLGVSVFARAIENVTVRELAFKNGAWLSRPANRGNAVAAGLEVEFKAKLAKLRPTWIDADVRANLAWNGSRIRSVPGPDNQLDKQRPLSANLGLDYRLQSVPLTLGSNVAYESGSRTRLSENWFATGNSRRLWEAYGVWKITSNAQLRVTFNNIVEQAAVEDQTYVDNDGTFWQRSTDRIRRAVKLALEISL